MTAAADRTLRGTVTRADAQGVYVEVPKLGVGVEFGPCQVLVPPWLLPQTELAGAHAHTHTDNAGEFGSGSGTTSQQADHRHQLVVGLLGLRRDTAVLLSTVNGVKEDLVVLGRLA